MTASSGPRPPGAAWRSATWAAGAILETSGGSIRLASAKGVVRATTSGGGIRLSGLTHGVTAKNAAGPISAEFTGEQGQLQRIVS